jgi:hypothetical protein
MTAGGPRLMTIRRDALLDAAAVVTGIVLIVFAATALNRLPYPGSQHYDGAVSLNVPAVPSLPDLLPETDAQPELAE